MNHKAYLACGCFWGSQSLLNQLKGVVSTQVGYMGDEARMAHYDIVKHGRTLHKEVVEVVYDATQLRYGQLVQYFFEIHDFTQADGQGPDIGEQYKSVIFYGNEQEHADAQAVINLLRQHNYAVATQLVPRMPFYAGEAYHQEYYAKNGQHAYCHLHRPLFAKL